MLTYVTDLAAADEIEKAADWYDAQREGLGDDFTEEVIAALYHIRNYPQSSQRIEGDLRRIAVQGFPYSIFYTIRADRIRVIACLHQARNTDPILKDRMS